jgi:hypothetical protein
VWSQKAASGLLSGQELMEKMGAPPKFNIAILGRVIKTNSEAYKNTLDSLSTYQKKLNALANEPNINISQGHFTSLRDMLNKVVVDAGYYLDDHRGDPGKKSRLAAMIELQAMAKAEIEILDVAEKFCRSAPTEEHWSFGQAATLARGGVHERAAVNFDLNDRNIDQVQSKNKFGSGKVNTVSLLHYNGVRGHEVRIAKPLSKAWPPSSRRKS